MVVVVVVVVVVLDGPAFFVLHAMGEVLVEVAVVTAALGPEEEEEEEEALTQSVTQDIALHPKGGLAGREERALKTDQVVDKQDFRCFPEAVSEYFSEEADEAEMALRWVVL